MVDTGVAPMLCCSSILGNSQLLWERVCEQPVVIHCVLAGICLRKACRRALKQSQRKNTELMYLIHVFWGAPWFSDLPLTTPGQERLCSAKALRGLQSQAGIWTRQACGGMTALQALARELQRWVGYLRVPKAMHMSPRQFSFHGCSQAGHEWKAPAWGAPSGPVLPEGLMLHTPWRQQHLLWARSPLPWDALHQPKRKQQ